MSAQASHIFLMQAWDAQLAASKLRAEWIDPREGERNRGGCFLRVVDWMAPEPLLVANFADILHRAADNTRTQAAILPSHAAAKAQQAAEQTARQRSCCGIPPVDYISEQNTGGYANRSRNHRIFHRLAKDGNQALVLEELILT
jgi:hypothetical protein